MKYKTGETKPVIVSAHCAGLCMTYLQSDTGKSYKTQQFKFACNHKEADT